MPTFSSLHLIILLNQWTKGNVQSRKDNLSKSSLTLNSIRELSWNKPQSSLEAISFGQLNISSLLKLEGIAPMKRFQLWTIEQPERMKIDEQV
jgi:hypothetical protein